jgi:hypothetical protein
LSITSSGIFTITAPYQIKGFDFCLSAIIAGSAAYTRTDTFNMRIITFYVRLRFQAVGGLRYYCPTAWIMACRAWVIAGP